jgi:hypothetical protein
MKNLTDFVIFNYFKTINTSDINRNLEFYSQVVEETAHMIALWQSVGCLEQQGHYSPAGKQLYLLEYLKYNTNIYIKMF